MSDIIGEVMQNGNRMAVKFGRNEDMHAAYLALVARLPKGLKNRGRVRWAIYPWDMDYGDVLPDGYMTCEYGFPL